jgi:CheY-like chemotaxis protein
VSVGAAFISNRLIPDGLFPAPFYIAAVIVATHVGGSGPALLSFVLASALLDYFDVPPKGSFAIRPELLPSLLQFVLPCAVGWWFVMQRKEIVAVGTVAEALEQLRTSSIDCVVTDLTLPDATGYDLLETMAENGSYSFPSVVVYTGRSLSEQDEQRLRKYSSSIIVKGARSPERLLDEVTLFLHQVESRLPPERQRMLKKARNREAVFEDRTVLVVEDDVRNVFALTTALEPKGMKVVIARNGREALEVLERTPDVHLVLMDIMMPELDGLEATTAIRRNPKWVQLPIIALTAKAMKDDHERCLQAGANDYLSKPLDVDILLSLLRVWMPK